MERPTRASPRMLSEMLLTVRVPQFSQAIFSLRVRKDIGVLVSKEVSEVNVKFLAT